MYPSKQTFMFLGLLFTGGAFALLLQHPSQALPQGNGNGNGPPPQSVIVVNGATAPVPVAGSVSVSGTVGVSGVTNVQGSVQASQSGPWTMRIDPAHNQVAVASAPTFDYDGTFSVVNDGASLDLGPFDIGDVSTLRILARAVNGDVRFQLIVPSPTQVSGMVMDDFTLDGESGNRYLSRSYDAPPSNVFVRVTEAGGPGGANYHVILVGR